MSVLIFELKKEHIELLRNLKWSVNKLNEIVNIHDNGEEYEPPFGTDTIYEAIHLILKGKTIDFNPLEDESFFECSKEEMEEYDKLYSELPIALEIILFNGNSELGTYKTKWNLREWKKVN